MIVVLTVLACVIPTLIYVAIIYSADSYEKEPFWLLAAVFFWGAIPSIVFSIWAGSVLDGVFDQIIGRNWNTLPASVLVAPVVEETFKGVALIGILIWRRNDIDSVLDGIIYGAMVGMGFAMVENAFYFTSQYESGGYAAWAVNVFFRAFVFGLNHALFSGLFGLGIAYGLLNRPIRYLAPVLGWIAAVAFHAVHNGTVGLNSFICLVSPLANWGGVLMTLGIINSTLRQEQAWLRDHLIEEIGLDVLSFSQYELVSDRRQRRTQLIDLFLDGNYEGFFALRRFLTACSKLAYQKHHATIHPTHRHDTTIGQLRAEIKNLTITT